MRLAVIGTGKMGRAIVSGLLSQGLFSPSDIVGVSQRESSKDAFLQLDKKLTWTNSVEEALDDAGVIVLSVKPFQMADILPRVASRKEKALYLSVAAGLRLASYEAVLGPLARIARAMPNTPVTLGAGVTAYAPNASCTAGDRELIERIFLSIGHCHRVDEDQLDAVTALSGSGPAFVYRLIEAMAAAAVREGLAPEQALPMAAQTFLGAARMVQETGLTPDVLVNQVVSKGGTTEAGLKILETGAMAGILASTLAAAARRSRELSHS